jgi:hypothetical protein
MVIKECPEWLRACRSVRDFPYFDGNITMDYPVVLDEINSQVRLSPIFLFLIDNSIGWRFDGYFHRRSPIIYFETNVDRTRFLLTVPSAIISYY